MDIRAILMGLAFALMWSSAFTSARVIVEYAPPLTALALRFLLSGLIGVGIAFALGQSARLTRTQWMGVLVFGVCQNALYLGLNFVAMQTIDASLAAIIASTMPLLVAVAGWAFFKEQVKPLGLAGLVAGVLGVMIRTVEGSLVKEKALKVHKGVYVDSLMQNSAAEVAGIKVGDVIYSVDDLMVSSSPELQGIIAQHRPGEEVEIAVNRKGKDLKFKVKLNNRDGNTEELTKEAGKLLKILGAKMNDVSDEIKSELDIEHGVIVEKIFPGKIRKQTRMQDGFIITHINNKKVKDMDDLLQKLDDQGGHMFEGVYRDIPGEYYYAIGL